MIYGLWGVECWTRTEAPEQKALAFLARAFFYFGGRPYTICPLGHLAQRKPRLSLVASTLVQLR